MRQKRVRLELLERIGSSCRALEAYDLLTGHEIGRLIELPKDIVPKTPSVGYRHENGNRRCELEIAASSRPDTKFTVFIRQNDKFIENFSIGLRYRTKDRRLGTITLVRYSGRHGETSRGLGQKERLYLTRNADTQYPVLGDFKEAGAEAIRRFAPDYASLRP